MANAENLISDSEKVVNIDADIFKTFLKQNEWIIHYLLTSLEGCHGCLFRVLKIAGANIAFPVSFTNASIYFLENDSEPFALGRAFRIATDMLITFFQSNPDDPSVPENPECRDALAKLLQFLANLDNVSAVLDEKNLPQWNLILRLAQHVFGHLSPYPNYKCDISSKYVGCPSNNKEEIFHGAREDTSFGWEDGWHGEVDILMAGVPIVSDITGSDDDDDDDDDEADERQSSPLPSSCSDTESSVSVEVKRREESFTHKEYGQFGAKTIAFSFLKNKEQINEVTMIPTIVISRENIQVHCYDSVKDVFVQTGLVRFLHENGSTNKTVIHVPAILLIWLTLNYKLFMTLDDVVDKSGLHQLIDVDKFRREIKAPCRSQRSSSQQWVADPLWTCGPRFVTLNAPQKYKNCVKMKPLSSVKSDK